MATIPTQEASGPPGAPGADVLLADGRIAVVRRLRVDDGDGVHALHDRVSDESLRLRFFAAGARSAAHRYVDHVLAQSDQLALVAEIGGEIVGLATSEPVDVDTHEIAFLVADEVQGTGLGTLLLEHLAAAARDQGVRHFTADVLLENRRMLRVIEDAGFDVRRRIDHGEVIVDIDTGMTTALQAAVDDREAYAEAASLRPLLRPATLAVAGVRADGSGVGAAILRAVVDGGYRGSVTVIHPRARWVQGVRAVSSLADVEGGAVDLLVMALPATACIALLEEGVGRVGAAVAISSGFGELGGDGVGLQARLARTARRAGIRLVGPNCLGVVCNDPQVHLNATFSRVTPPAGGLAVASQSGAVGIVLMDLARRLDLGVSCFVSLGNKADVSGNDLLAAWSQDPAVTAAALYLESFGNARKFARLARRFSQHKPLLAVVGGRSAGGQRAGLSHTAAAATPESGVAALLAQSGVIRCGDADDLARTALVLTRLPLPAGRRLGVISNGGGLGVLTADAANDQGLDVVAFSPGLQKQLGQVVEGTSGTSNPVDTGAAATPAQLGAAVDLVLESGEVDAVIAVVVATTVTDDASSIAAVAAASRRRVDVPVVLVPLGGLNVPPGEGLVSLDSTEAAAKALGRAAAHREWRDATLAHPAEKETPRVPSGRPRRTARRLLHDTGEGWLTHAAAAELLTAGGITVSGELAGDVDAAAVAAARCGYPVAVKTADPRAVHRTEQGLVRTGIGSATELADVLAPWQDREGLFPVVIQPMHAGTEIALGIVRDPVLGPLVMVGAGGVNVDVWDDRTWLVPPVSAADASRAVRSLRVWRLLRGHRGGARGDVLGLERVILSLSRLALEVPEVAELDLNPVLVGTDGCALVDVKVRLADADSPVEPGPRQLREVSP